MNDQARRAKAIGPIEVPGDGADRHVADRRFGGGEVRDVDTVDEYRPDVVARHGLTKGGYVRVRVRGCAPRLGAARKDLNRLRADLASVVDAPVDAPPHVSADAHGC